MAKKSSLVDKALEVSRKNRVPKKPVKTKGKKTVPAVLDWGTGIPEDKLAYLNDDEMALVQAKREFKGKREVNGVPAFADDSASSTGMSRGDKSGTKGSTGAGAGGLGGGNKGSPGNSPGGSPNAGGSKASPSGGQPNSPGGAGGQNATPSGGPGGGSLSAPARTTPSSAPSSPAGFGPRQSNMPGNPVSAAPSTQSWQGAVDHIAQGSSVVGNPRGVKQFTDRVQQAAPKAVNYSQTPTVGPNRGLGSFPAAPAPSYQPSDMRALTRSFSALNGPNQGLGYSPAAPGSFAQTDYSIGGNGPLSDEGVSSYDRNAQDRLNAKAATSGLDTGILGPPVPAGTAIQRDPYFGGSPTMAAASAAINPQTGLPVGEKITDRLPGSESIPPGDVYKTPGPVSAPVVAPNIGVNPNLYSSPIKIQQPVSPPVDRLVQLSNYAIQRQTPENLSAAFANPNAAWGEFAGMENAMNRVPASSEFNSFGRNLPSEYTGGFNSSPASAPTTSYSENSFNTGYPNPGPQADISPSQGDYSPSQAPAYDVSPSQQGKWTNAQRNSYLNSLGDNKTGRIQVSQNGGQPQGSPVTPAAPMTTLAAMPDWVDYSYLYNDYPQLALGATPNIGAFNQYNATFRRGGRVGDSIEAALRLALQGIVSRNKTS